MLAKIEFVQGKCVNIYQFLPSVKYLPLFVIKLVVQFVNGISLPPNDTALTTVLDHTNYFAQNACEARVAFMAKLAVVPSLALHHQLPV